MKQESTRVCPDRYGTRLEYCTCIVTSLVLREHCMYLYSYLVNAGEEDACGGVLYEARDLTLRFARFPLSLANASQPSVVRSF